LSEYDVPKKRLIAGADTWVRFCNVVYLISSFIRSSIMIMPILSVKDVDASVAFYKDILGFNHDFSMPGPDGKTTFAGVSLGKASFGLSLEPEVVRGGDGVTFMVYIPDERDLDTYYREVQANGAKIEHEIKDEYWGDRVFTLRDNSGYHLSLCKTVKQMSMEEIAAAASQQTT
jgi:uncharacterized glyoxalase superfamily protein PhnB